MQNRMTTSKDCRKKALSRLVNKLGQFGFGTNLDSTH